jgi:hypothetical protein
MSEWLTYSLSDFLLFSPRTYYRLFELYNRDIWPAQVVAGALGLVILGLLLRGGMREGRWAAAILAACWLWVAWHYLFLRYNTINWAGEYFAIGFAIEALLLGWWGLIRRRLHLQPGLDLITAAGLGIFLFALVVHPLIGPLVGREWMQAEIFGVAPDPTVVATLGVLLAATRPHWELLVIPFIWCAISGATAWTMQSPDAPVMPLVAVLALGLAIWKALSRRRYARVISAER